VTKEHFITVQHRLKTFCPPSQKPREGCVWLQDSFTSHEDRLTGDDDGLLQMTAHGRLLPLSPKFGWLSEKL
jgi:hypothetical protein